MISLENLCIRVLDYTDQDEYENNLSDPSLNTKPIQLVCMYQRKKYFLEHPSNACISIKFVTSMFFSIKLMRFDKVLTTFDVSFQDLETSGPSSLERTLSKDTFSLVLLLSADKKLKYHKNILETASPTTPGSNSNKMKQATDQTLSETYNGDLKDKKRHGKGELFNQNGKYFGMWSNDVKDGYGIFITKTYTYYGLWKNDKKDGYGIQIFSDGSSYCGFFSNDIWKGQGSIEFSNGHVVFGEWKGDSVKEVKFKLGTFESSNKACIHQLRQGVNEIDASRLHFGGEKFLSGFSSKKDFCRDSKKFEPLMDKYKNSFLELSKKFDALHSDRGVWPLIYQHSEPHGLLYDMFDVFFYVTKSKYTNIIKWNRSHLAHVMDDILTFVESMSIRFHDTLGKWKRIVTYSNLYYHVKDIVMQNFFETLFGFYIKASLDKERELKYKILSLGECTLSDFGVAPKFIPKSTKPFEKAIEKLRETMKRTQLDDILKGLEESNQEILMEIHGLTQKGGFGAEDIFPISVYVFYKARLENSCGFTQMLNDLYDDNISQREEFVRVTNLGQILDFIMMLEVDVRDQAGVLVPFETLSSRIENHLVNNQYSSKSVDLKWLEDLFVEVSCKNVSRNASVKESCVLDALVNVNEENKNMVGKIIKSVGMNLEFKDEKTKIEFETVYSREIYLRFAKLIAKWE